MLAWAGHKLGVLLGSIVNLLDIRTIIVGGGVSAAGDYLLEPARETLPEYVIPPMRNDLKIVREKMGNEVSLLGAAQLAFAGDEAKV
jgi:glucokinase